MSSRRSRRALVPSFLRLLFTGVCLLLTACGTGDYRRIDGSTMGTYYAVTTRCPEPPADLDARIASVLAEVNAQMSTYDKSSTLSRFNDYEKTDWFPVEPAVARVVSAAQTISRQSDGAFDVTVGPLVNLWGFGPDVVGAERPSPEALSEARSRVGYRFLEVQQDPPALRKSVPVYVDLSAIAKGFGVDQVAALLDGLDCADFLVDVGGEVRARGVNPSGRVWRVGVEVPDPDSAGGVQRVLALDNLAVATSGDYRNFRDLGGRRFSHTIDPRTGAPVSHALASVSVVHESTMWADGYATAIDVLGPEDGLALANELELPVLLVVRTADGFEERYNQPLFEFLVVP